MPDSHAESGNPCGRSVRGGNSGNLVGCLRSGLLGVCRIGRTEEAKECWSGLRSDYGLHESMLSQIVG